MKLGLVLRRGPQDWPHGLNVNSAEAAHLMDALVGEEKFAQRCRCGLNWEITRWQLDGNGPITLPVPWTGSEHWCRRCFRTCERIELRAKMHELWKNADGKTLWWHRIFWLVERLKMI